VSRQISRVATIVLVLFGALFVNLNVITLLQADDLANHPSNRRLIVREYAIDRGPIVVGEEAIARSEETDGELRFLRVYPDGPLYAHLTGYYSIVLQRSGLEAAMNEELTGRPTEVVAQNLGEFLGSRDRAGNAVELTIVPAAQQAARTALAGREGAVVAIDPTSGAVLASYANPSFDPNPLSSHDPRVISEAWEPLRDDPSQPLVDRATRQVYPPGSAFKIVTAAAALERGVQPDAVFPDELVYDVPQTTADIGNFGGGVCLDGTEISLADAFRVSCNTTFARLGNELGPAVLVDQAERFGFNLVPPYELDVVPSTIPSASELDAPATAQSAIGQRDVRATPMQMALVAAAIANGGELMQPHVVAGVRSPDGDRVRGAEVERWAETGADGNPITPRTADQLRTMMVNTVRSGTGTAAQIDGVEVGGKTGTAQTGSGPPVAWFVGFAGRDVAIAVMLPDAGDDATGGRVAAPLAREVMAAVLGAGG
jgi:penicillin-binding protein A